MQKYVDLLMGLVSGLALMLLNNNILRTSLNSMINLFNPLNLSKVEMFLLKWIYKTITMLSFIGMLVTIICAILILKKVIMKK